MVCPEGYDTDAGLCYPRCAPGFTGPGPVCWRSTGSSVPAGMYKCTDVIYVRDRGFGGDANTDACNKVHGPIMRSGLVAVANVGGWAMCLGTIYAAIGSAGLFAPAVFGGCVGKVAEILTLVGTAVQIVADLPTCPA